MEPDEFFLRESCHAEYEADNQDNIFHIVVVLLIKLITIIYLK
jgi:hypothetical protein